MRILGTGVRYPVRVRHLDSRVPCFLSLRGISLKRAWQWREVA